MTKEIDSGSTPQAGSTALAHVTVLDLTRSEAGAIGTLMLSWLGASIVRVEAPSEPKVDCDKLDPRSVHMATLRADKKSITLDVDSPRGRELALRLSKKVDIVLTDGSASEVAGRDLGYDVFRKVNERIIYGRISAFADGSPYADAVLNEGVAQAAGGLAAITGEMDREPLISGIAIAGTSAGLYLIVGVLAALLQRDRTGRGQDVSVAMQDAVTGIMRAALAQASSFGKNVPRCGNSGVFAVPFDIYPTMPDVNDDYVFLFVPTGNAEQWGKTAKLIGHPEAAEDPAYSVGPERLKRREEVDGWVLDWMQSRNKIEAMEALGGQGLVAGAVMTVEEIVARDDFRSTGIVVELNAPDGQRIPVPGMPITLSEEGRPLGVIPAVGEHTDGVLRDWLGLDAEEVSALRAEGVI